MTDLSRRDFLKFVRDGFLYISGALAFGGLLRFLDYESNPAPKTEFAIGSADNYPLGSRTSIPEIPALLIHSEQGFIAFSLTCTHLGCTLENDAQGFACPCHSSRFDADGHVIHGPATRSLVPLRIEITGDHLLILHTD